MDDFLKSYLASGRGQSPKDFRKTYEEKQKNKELYDKGEATRVITGYSTQRVGPSGSTKKPIYDYIPKQAAPPAAPAPPDPPAPPAAPDTLMPTISDASTQYRADTDARNAEIDKKIADFDASVAAATKAREIADDTRIRDFLDKQKADQDKQKADQATQSENLARSNQLPNLQIQPASSTPKTGGTQTFKKRSIASNRKQQLTSGINLGTSSLLNI